MELALRACPAWGDAAEGTDPARIAEVVTQLLGDAAIRSAAAALGEDIRSRDGAAVAADLIEEVATSRPRVSVP